MESVPIPPPEKSGPTTKMQGLVRRRRPSSAPAPVSDWEDIYITSAVSKRITALATRGVWRDEATRGNQKEEEFHTRQAKCFPRRQAADSADRGHGGAARQSHVSRAAEEHSPRLAALRDTRPCPAGESVGG